MKQANTNRKREALSRSGTLNLQPSRVQAPVFQAGDFFDARDRVQVKYEMLRCVEIDGVSVHASAALFGFSRVGWYQIKAKYDRCGLAGLLPQRRGPKPPKKHRPPRWRRSRPVWLATCMSNMNS